MRGLFFRPSARFCAATASSTNSHIGLIGVFAIFRLSRDKVVLCTLLLALLVLGGASRADALSQAFVRAVAICGLVAVFWKGREQTRLDARPLVALLAGWTALIAVQLVPLPPFIWTALPGRGILVDFYEVLEAGQPWRPITLQPHMTFNSLLAMLVPWAALLTAARLRGDEIALEVTVLVFLVLTICFGMLQMASGGRAFYFYEITSAGSPVGLFSNRNHNAFAISMIVPLLTHILLRRSKGDLQPGHLALLVGTSFAALVSILVIGSRTGLLLMLLALVGSWLLIRRAAKSAAAGRSRKHKALAPRVRMALLAGGLLAAALSAISVFILYGERFLALRRMGGSVENEDRLAFLPVIAEVAGKYMPTGAGFGTFPAVFKIDEPDHALRLYYLNHAHNDAMEIAVEGGIVAVLLALAFLALWGWRSVAAWREDAKLQDVMQARLGAILSGLLLIGSLTDYPLRSPACAAIFAIACYWLFRGRQTAASRSNAPLTTRK